ncbi:MAG: PIN domain-containing protein [Bacteroidetes bacterium]|jgi:predicted nucleic acid-binding protein|nr:PIN domain-containing protein [Bacteroidota bacterium]
MTIVDTGPLVTLLYRREAHHRWVVRQFEQLTGPLYTCEAVVSEAHFLLQPIGQGRARLMELLAAGRFDLTFSYASHQARVDALMQQYADVPMAFADACLVTLAEQTGGPVLTLDGDFRIYRAHGDQRLQVIMP